MAAILGGLAKTLRGLRKFHASLKNDITITKEDVHRLQKQAMPIVGLTDVIAEKEIGEEIEGHKNGNGSETVIRLLSMLL